MCQIEKAEYFNMISQKHPKVLKNQFEKDAWASGQLVCGIDEVGRGCLAGPVVTGAVILPPNTSYRLLKDSKEMSESDRNQAFSWICEKATYATATMSWQQIDRLNIYQATRRAMKQAAIGAISQVLDQNMIKYVVIDAMPLTLPGYEQIECHSFIKGETYSNSIAAASILAKVIRDRLMATMATSFPAYGLARSKGYGTKEHLVGLDSVGTSIIHRQSFLSKISLHEALGAQQSLFEETK